MIRPKYTSGWTLPETLLMLGILLAFTIGICLSAATAYWKETAVEEGHAEFYIDAEHEKQWRWLERVPPSERIRQPSAARMERLEPKDLTAPLSRSEPVSLREPTAPSEPRSESAPKPLSEPTHRKEP